MLIAIIFLLIEKVFKFKADNKNVNFPTQFCLGSISVILNINKYLMAKTNIK